MLELDSVTVSFPDGEGTVTPLNEVSLRVAPGELVAVVGESGSGKSTLLSVAAGLIAPSSGRALIDAAAITDAVRRERIGLIFQTPNLLSSLTVREQLLITDHLRGQRGSRRERRERRAHADELLARVGLSGLGDRRVQRLSGGQRQRVNIARALMGSPSVLLADEPTSALDQSLSREIVTLLAELTAEQNLAAVLVTHDRSQLDLVDRVVEMRDAALVAVG